MRMKSPLAALVHPEQALGLLVSALGHDVGHPGVNNPLLVRLNAPLAQLYNDISVPRSIPQRGIFTDTTQVLASSILPIRT